MIFFSLHLQSKAKDRSFSWYYLFCNVGTLGGELGMPVLRQSVGFIISWLTVLGECTFYTQEVLLSLHLHNFLRDFSSNNAAIFVWLVSLCQEEASKTTLSTLLLSNQKSRN